jgi:two-component system, cell cycle sensor histidine kinase and response regulator CckA
MGAGVSRASVTGRLAQSVIRWERIMETRSKFSILPSIEVLDKFQATWARMLDILSEIMHVPVALVMRVHERQIEVFAKSSNDENVYEAGEMADLDTGLYCETVMASREELLVPDAQKESDWDHNPDIELGMVSYLGLPVRWPTGEIFGTICVLDRKENHYTEAYRNLLEQFRSGVETGLAAVHREDLLRREVAAKGDALEALSESEQLYRQMFFDHSAIMQLIDPETGAIVEANPAAAEFYGYSVEELQRMTIQQINTLSPEEVFRRRHEARQRKRNYFVSQHRLASGEVRDVEVHSVPIEIKGHTLLYSVIHDITERKRAEEELARYRGNLEELIEERTTELRETELQLQQSQKLEAIGRLAGGVAHDFNNLLTVILGYTESLVTQFQRDDPLRKDLDHIMEAGQRAASLTRQLLAFGRKQALQPEVLNLNGAVSSLGAMLQRLIGEDIDLVTVLADDPWNVKADRSQVEQVVMNLAVNARDAMPKGGKLTIETSNVFIDEQYAEGHVDVEPGPYAMFAVTDTGCGMDEQVKRRLFEPFFTTKEKGKGTGLGLSTVYGIVRQSGGNIWVYSEPGQGTTFKIYLPREEEEAAAKPAARTKPRGTRGSGEIVLLVDDDRALGAIFERMLKSLGYRCTITASGEEALLAVEENGLRPDLLITDVVMTGMKGNELAEKLHKILPELEVLYISGYTDNAIAHHGVLDEDTFFLQKPFGIESLAAKIKEVLGSD